MDSENHRLRRQVVDLQYENTYMCKITEMQAENISLRKQVSDLEKEIKRLSHLVSKSSKNKSKANSSSTQDDESSSDEEYYTADEGPDNLFDRYCKTCKRDFKYPCRLKHHKCKKV